MQFGLISKPKLISTNHVDFIRMGLKNNKSKVSPMEWSYRDINQSRVRDKAGTLHFQNWVKVQKVLTFHLVVFAAVSIDLTTIS